MQIKHYGRQTCSKIRASSSHDTSTVVKCGKQASSTVEEFHWQHDRLAVSKFSESSFRDKVTEGSTHILQNFLFSVGHKSGSLGLRGAFLGPLRSIENILRESKLFAVWQHRCGQSLTVLQQLITITVRITVVLYSFISPLCLVAENIYNKQKLYKSNKNISETN